MADIQQPPFTFSGANDNTFEDLSASLNTSTQQQVDSTVASTNATINSLMAALSNTQSIKFPSFNFNSTQNSISSTGIPEAPVDVTWNYAVDTIAAAELQYSAPVMGTLLSVTQSSSTAPPSPDIQFNTPASPDIQEIAPSFPGSPGDVAIGNIGSLDVGSPPTLTATMPSINVGAAPSAFGKSAPTMAALPDRSYPNKPQSSLPEVPLLRSLTLPDPPDLLSIEFSAATPIPLDAPPDIEINFTEVVYDSELLTTLKNKLLDLVHNARQSGLNAVIEQQIKDAGRSRSLSASKGYVDQVSRYCSRSGWQSPEYLIDRLFDAQEFYETTDITEIRSAALILSDLEQKNFKFSIEQSVQLEGKLIDLHNKVQQRSFELSKAILNAAISAYKIKATYFNAGVALYSAQSQVYQSRIQAELSKVELYRSQLEGQKLIGELNAQDIDNYKAQIAAVVAIYGLYNAELEAVKIQLEADALKIKQFDTAIDAFSVEIQAKSLEYDGYKAAISGENLKARIFDSMVNAYGAQIDAYSTGVDAQVLKLDADIRANIEAPLQVSDYAAKKFAAIIEAEGKYLKAIARNDDTAVAVFSALIDAEKSRVSNVAEVYSSEIDAFKALNKGEESRLKTITGINRTSAEIYRAEILAEISRLKGIVALDSNNVEILKALNQKDIASTNIMVANYKASVAKDSVSITGHAEMANAQAEMNKVKSTASVARMDASLDIAAAEIAKTIEERDQAVKSMIAAAQAQAQIISANASTVNIHKGFTETSHESTSVSVNGYSYSENDSTTIQG